MQVALLIYKKVRSRALTTQQALNTTLAENFLNVTGIRTLMVAQQYCQTIFSRQHFLKQYCPLLPFPETLGKQIQPKKLQYEMY